MILARHTSDDGILTLVAEQIRDDVQIGFEGLSWHTHGDILAQLSGLPLRQAVERFVDELLKGQHLIAVLRMNGALVDAWVTDEPARDALHKLPGEDLEFRYWDGTEVQFGDSR